MARKKPSYYPVVAAFDIETTSYTDDGEKKACVYSYCLQIEDDIKIYREREDFLRAIDDLTVKYNTSEGRRLVIYVHNLAYEWAFIRRYFEWAEAFANGKAHNIIRAVTTSGIEFRCSYALTNQSLAQVGAMVGVSKMVGDLDYSLIRHQETPLTPEEIGYIENDTKIIVALIRKKLSEGEDLASIPMTATGAVRKDVRNACRSDDYIGLMAELTLTEEIYSLSRAAYQGGFTHANASIVGETLSGVVAYDLASSYPSSLAQFTYPISKFVEIGPRDLEELCGLFGKGHFIIDLEMSDIESQYYFPPLSESRCIEIENPIVDNGRVWSASRVRTIVTDVDLRTYMRAYAAADIRAVNVWFARSDYLPRDLVVAILSYYRDKTRFKGVEGEEDTYRISKERVNSIYGMIGTDPVRDEYELQGDEMILQPVNIPYSIETYNNSRNRFLYYPWGAWCTAYSRWVLLETIYDLEDAGVTVAYCDTDSIYAVDHPEIPGIISRASENITSRLEAALKSQGIKNSEATELINPADKFGERHALGVFDKETETPLEQFKTLGAKRYAKVDGGKFSITVAGLHKKQAAAYVEANGGMDAFTPGLVVPAGHSGRSTHLHSGAWVANHLIDYLGNVAMVEQDGFIHLEETEYHMSIGVEYESFLSSVRGL